jgi:hypothetical protein
MRVLDRNRNRGSLVQMSFCKWFRAVRAGLLPVVALTSLGAIAALPGESAAKSRVPIEPSQIMLRVSNYVYNNIYNSTDQFDIRHAIVDPHSLVREGACTKEAMLLQFNKYELQDSKEDYEVYCTKEGGKYESLRVPASKLQPVQTSMDLVPIITEEGDQAASSSNVGPDGHGKPSRLVLNFQPAKHQAEAHIYYRRGTDASTKQLRELTITQEVGKTTPHESWYAAS